MTNNPTDLLNRKLLNGWNLFWLIMLPISLGIMLAMSRADLSGATAVSSMIRLSVRCAVPWLFLAFVASALQSVFPGPFSRWLARNRRIMGLCFAASMAWQLFFILWLVIVHIDYYVDDVYVLSDVVEGVTGYVLLIAMTLTSFRFGRQHLTRTQWNLLHTAGIYWLWFYAWSVYWFALFYYESPAASIDYVYYWGGLTAWGLRLVAWTKKGQQAAASQQSISHSRQPLYLVTGAIAIVFGLVGCIFGLAWSPQVYDFLFAFELVRSIDTFMPYFPLVPFYPLFLMMLGGLLIVKSRPRGTS